MTKSTLHNLLILLNLAGVLLFAGCGGCGALIGDMPDAGDMATFTCANAGQSCTSSPDCCSGICTNNLCEASCGVFNQACAQNADCCSGVCDMAMGKCVQPLPCKVTGSSCALGSECCGLSCVGGSCGGSCTSDGQNCATSGECCSGNCPSAATASCPNAGKCCPLNTGCKTSGNTCTQDTECCSGLCTGAAGSKTCSANSSFCHQDGDICAKATDCCSQTCTTAAGQNQGTCQTLPVSGAGGCDLSGNTCGTSCGCCSALCLTFGSGPSKVCQQPSGCHMTGDLCVKDSDCCGAPGTGLPGDGNVYCDIPVGFKIGVCHKPMGCQPEGGSCKFTGGGTLSCTTYRNDCCNAPGSQTAAVCKLDTEGVPRCFGLKDGACVAAGGTCSASFDCCNNNPCVPDAMGTLRCGASCSAAGGGCTVSGDCCDTGFICVTTPGSVQGVCTAPPGGGGGGACPEYGQPCTVGGTPCCNGVRCSQPGGSASACNPGQTGCTCYNQIG